MLRRKRRSKSFGMDELGAFEVLECDPRATFVCERGDHDVTLPLEIVFRNKALRNHHSQVLEQINSGNEAAVSFRRWLTLEGFENGSSLSREFADVTWTAFTFEDYVIVSAVSPVDSEEPTREVKNGIKPPNSTIHDHTMDSVFDGWTSQTSELTQHVEYIREVDWSKTCLGPYSSWSQDLVQVLNIMLQNPRPVCLFMGSYDTMLYNGAWAHDVARERNPSILGKPYLECFPDPILAENGVTFPQLAKRRGKSIQRPEAQAFTTVIGEDHTLEERWFESLTIPLLHPLDGCAVYINETTQTRIAKRRFSILERIRDECTTFSDINCFFPAIMQSIHSAQHEFPWSILYSADVTVDSEEAINHTFTLIDSFGFNEGETSIPHSVDLERETNDFSKLLRQASVSDAILHLCRKNETLPRSFYGYGNNRGFQDDCWSAAVIPVSAPNGVSLGYLITGLNTRRPFDADYKVSLTKFQKTLSSSAAKILQRMEQDLQRRLSSEQNAKKEADINHTLALRTREATESSGMLDALHTVLEMSDVGVFHFDSNGTLLQANDAWFALSGHPKHIAEPGDLSFLNLVYEEDAALVMSMWSDLILGKPVTFEMRWKYQSEVLTDEERETKSTWILAACVPIMDNGTVISIAGMTTDITLQKRRAEDAFQKAEAQQRFFKFAELSPMAIYIVNPTKGVEYCNAEFFEVLGLPRTDVENVVWEDCILPEDAHIVQNTWSQLLNGESPSLTNQFRLKRRWTSPAGVESHAWTFSTNYTELNDDGSVKTINGCMIDISQLKWAEKLERLRTEDALEQKRQQEFFIDTTSHEMRNPLSAVLQCADSANEILEEMNDIVSSLMQAESSERLQQCIAGCTEAVQTIIACSKHQKNIVDDILTLSKLDSRLLLISPALANPTSVLEDAVHMFTIESQKVDISLKSKLDPSVHEIGVGSVMIDASRVTQILINLLTNAIKFTQNEPKREITVTLGATTEKPPQLPGPVSFVSGKPSQEDFLDKSEWGTGPKIYLWITVQDTGCGLSQSQQDKLFQRFSQAFTPRTHVKYGGSGLGLFISKSLAELQGGEIGVASEAGVGSVFGFYIATRLMERSQPGKRKPSLKALGSQLAAHYHVLVVEDNLVNQKVLAQQLRKAGCQVDVAGHGGEALEFLRRTKHWKGQRASELELSVILMDIEMPVMDGLTCARKIRELETEGVITSHLPIIAVSANARIQQIMETSQAGMDDAITKPFRIPELLVKVQRLVG